MDNHKYKFAAFALAAGCFAGAVTIIYRLLLSRAEKIMFAVTEFVRGNIFYTAAWFAVLILLALITAFLLKCEPYIGGSGIPQVEAETRGYINQCWYKVLLCKLAGGVLCVLGGLSLGREGPSIQLGAMAGKGLCRRTGCKSEREKNILLSCGASAGLAAAFNAPLAGIMFSIEEVHKSLSPALLTALMLSSFISDFLSKLVFGQQPVFTFELKQFVPLKLFPVLIIMSIILGIAGTIYNIIIPYAQRIFKKIKKPFNIVIPFILAGILGKLIPDVLGSGHSMISILEYGGVTLRFLLTLLAVKFIFSAISFGSGVPGGIFFPLLVLGAYIGGCFGMLNICGEYIYNIIIIAMAGLFSSIVRAPVTGIILICEMSGSSDILPLVTVSAISYITAGFFKSKPIYDILLANLINKPTEEIS